jgi:hypothetical protein
VTDKLQTRSINFHENTLKNSELVKRGLTEGKQADSMTLLVSLWNVPLWDRQQFIFHFTET